MKALLLSEIGGELVYSDYPDPLVLDSGVIISVLAVRIPSYTKQVIDGTLKYDIYTPLVPGPTCIGKIEQVGKDVFNLKVGQIVLCNSFLSSEDVTDEAENILIGWTGSNSDRSLEMQKVWRNGSFAQQALYPARCAIPLPGAEAYPMNKLPIIASLAIAYGGLITGKIEAGQTILINGASGQLGSCAVLAALAIGAGIIIISGRNEEKLKKLSALSPRIFAYVLLGDVVKDAEFLKELGNGKIDAVVDYLGNVPDATVTQIGIEVIKNRGNVVLVGGVKHDLTVPYSEIMRKQLSIRGSYMINSKNVSVVWELIKCGLIDLENVQSHVFPLQEFNGAVDKAETVSGLEISVLLPNL